MRVFHLVTISHINMEQRQRQQKPNQNGKRQHAVKISTTEFSFNNKNKYQVLPPSIILHPPPSILLMKFSSPTYNFAFPMGGGW